MSSKSLTRKDAALQQTVSNGCQIPLFGPASWNVEDMQPLLQQVCTSVLAAGIVCFIKESDNAAHANDVEGHTHVLFFSPRFDKCLVQRKEILSWRGEHR